MAKTTLNLTLEGSSTVVLTLSRKGSKPEVSRFKFPSADEAQAGILRVIDACRELILANF